MRPWLPQGNRRAASQTSLHVASQLIPATVPRIRWPKIVPRKKSMTSSRLSAESLHHAAADAAESFAERLT
jgi:hypothetical protein